MTVMSRVCSFSIAIAYPLLVLTKRYSDRHAHIEAALCAVEARLDPFLPHLTGKEQH